MKLIDRNTLFVILLLCLPIISLGQVSNENLYSLRKQGLFKYESIVFKENYKVNILISDIKERYTPDSSDILKAENIFLDNYHLFNEEPKSSNRDATHKIFYKYKRQFFGYISETNEKKIVIQLIDCSKPGRTKKILGRQWEMNFVNHFSDYRTVKIFIYNINLDKNKLERM